MAAKAKSKQPKPTPTEQAELFGQLLDSLGSMPIDLARRILKIKSTDEDRDRLSDLLNRNGEGGLSASELAELDDRVRSGTWMTILQNLARGALAKSKPRAVARA